MKNIILVFILCLGPMMMAAGQEQQAQKLLSEAIYQEEVNGDLDGAVKTYQLILDKFPDKRKVCAEAMLHLGICYEKLGLEQARQTYRDVISKYSEQADKVSIAQERISRLDAYTAELIAKAEEHFKQGNELFKRWEFESAIKEYENAVKSGPNTQLALNARYWIGQSWFRAGKYDAALTTFTKLIEENPKSNIAPVTELMVAQVKYAMENDNDQRLTSNVSDENTIVNSETGITYKKVKSLAGESDIITYTTDLNLSSNGRFLLTGNMVVPIDGTAPFELIDFKSTGSQPTRGTWSPDGTKAAFYADSAIWMVPVSPETGHSNGSPVKFLDGKYRWNYNVSWSPDGGKIVFQRIDNKYAGSIWTLNITDGSLAPVTDEGEGLRGPVWTPDGKSIAYWKNRRQIWFSPAEGGIPEKIVDIGGVPVLFSPDGKWLYHSSWEISKLFCLADKSNLDFKIPDEVGTLIAITPDTKKMIFFRSSYEDRWGLKVASSSGGPSFEPARDNNIYSDRWSGDAKTILYQGEDPESQEGDIGYWIIPLAGGESQKLFMDVNVNGKPFPFDVSPDLKKLVFTVARDDGTKDIYIVPVSVKDARTTGPAQLIFERWTVGAYNVDFSWSDDGTKIALIHEKNIWIVPLSGGKPVKITNNTEGKSWIDWSPDGEMLSFYTDYIKDKTSRTLNVILLSGGNSMKVFENCVTASWSQDSRQFSVNAGGKVYVVSVDGSKIKQIFDQADHGLINLSSAKWSPDGKNLAFLGSDSKAEDTHLFMISSEGGKITRLAKDDNSYKYSLKWSPDGKWLSYLTEDMVKVRPESTIWEADFEEVVEKLAK